MFVTTLFDMLFFCVSVVGHQHMLGIIIKKFSNEYSFSQDAKG